MNLCTNQGGFEKRHSGNDFVFVMFIKFGLIEFVLQQYREVNALVNDISTEELIFKTTATKLNE